MAQTHTSAVQPATCRDVQGPTTRALLVGALGALGVGFGCVYGTMVLRGSYMDLDFSTPGAVFLFFVLFLVSRGLLRWLRPAWALQPREMITVYIMMIVASAIPTMGLTGQILPLITAPRYFATPENKWQETLLPYLPQWATVQDEQMARHLFDGAPETVAVPWGRWLKPLLAWTPLVLGLHLSMMCMMVIARKQWVERERLTYPLTQLPLSLVAHDDPRFGQPLLRSPTAWIGLAIPLLVTSFVGLHNYLPLVPAPRLDYGIPLYRQHSWMVFRLSFPMVGFFYIVPLDVLFSLWFFNLLFFNLQGIMSVAGWDLRENAGPYGANSALFKHLGMGAMIALVLSGVRVAIPHLRDVWRGATGGAREADDHGELIGYRAALWGMVLGLALMGLWIRASGMPILMVAVFLFGAFVLFVGLTRIVAEAGLAEAVASIISPSFVVSGFGTSPLGKPGLAAMGLTYVWCSDIRTYVMASTANGLKLADTVGLGGRRLFGGLGLSLLLAIGSSVWLTLRQAYAEGGQTLNSWFFNGGPLACWQFISNKIDFPSGPFWPGWLVTGIGAAVLAFLTQMRQLFMWWPLHPLGFTVAGTWIMDQLWLTCFTAWLLKLLILRYGGMKLYRTMRPLFLGLILGQFTCNGIWLFVDHFAGKRGNQIFWI